VRFREQRNRPIPHRHGRGVIRRQARDDALDGLAVGEDEFLRPTATGEAHASQRERRRHDLHEVSAIDTVETGRALGKFARDLRLETGRAREFVEAAPVFRTGQLLAAGRGGMIKFAFHRWQPEQL
jgi:hypothetical protein